MGELFAEIQTLKDQLQRAIQTNSALKTKLEEQVISGNNQQSQSQPQTEIPISFTTTTHNLSNGDCRSHFNNMSPQSCGLDETTHLSDEINRMIQSPPSSGAPSVAEFQDNLKGEQNGVNSPRFNGHSSLMTRQKSLDTINRLGESKGNHRDSSRRATLTGPISCLPRQRGVSAHSRLDSPSSSIVMTGRQDSSSDLKNRQSSTLFAVGRLEEFEHLKREIEESFSILRTLENKVKARLSVLIHQQQQHVQNNYRSSPASPAVQALAASEALHLKELQLSASELRVCLNQQRQLTQQFQVNQLPPINARGKFVDVELLSENTHLIEQVTSWKSKYEAAERLLRQMQEKLECRNRAKEVAEGALYSRLANHEEILHRVKTNLQQSYGKFVDGKPPRRTPLPDKVYTFK